MKTTPMRKKVISDFGPEVELRPLLHMHDESSLLQNGCKTLEFQLNLNFCMEMQNERVMKSGNETANINRKTVLYTCVNGDRSKTANIMKS